MNKTIMLIGMLLLLTSSVMALDVDAKQARHEFYSQISTGIIKSNTFINSWQPSYISGLEIVNITILPKTYSPLLIGQIQYS
jgi:hypothetical protein